MNLMPDVAYASNHVATLVDFWKFVVGFIDKAVITHYLVIRAQRAKFIRAADGVGVNLDLPEVTGLITQPDG